LLLQKVRTISADVLAARLGATSPSALHAAKSGAVLRNGFLLIDCRPFIAYNVNHIRGAINVNCCDRFNRKRLQQGKASLADLATTKEGKELLKKRGWREVIVYDDCSESLELLPVSHTLFLVMNALMEDHREPVMLLGGLRDFQVANRGLCEDYLMPSAITSGTPMLLPDLPSPSELCDTKDIENHPATQVLPYLFLGNMRDASDVSVLKRLGIKYVLNVTAKPPDYELDPDIVYKQLEAADNGIQNLRQFFEEAFDFIDEARTNNSGVLIHCHAGVSRSPTIAVAYLMKHYPMAMAEAYKFIKMRRSIISPNLNFMGQLWEFEQGLRATPSTAVKEPLTVEMQEVADSVRSTPSSSSSSSYFFSDGSSSSSSACTTASSSMSSAVSCHSFCWAEPPSTVAHHHHAHHRRPSKDDVVSSGCSV
jgi:dual specificity MAP kinase phosphatase